MGMFDYLRCEYPLPDEAPVDGWQTKDTPNQVLEKYVITRDVAAAWSIRAARHYLTSTAMWSSTSST